MLEAAGRLVRLIAKIWDLLPVDGASVIYLGPDSSHRLVRAGAKYAWRRVPRWCRPVAIPLVRLTWLVACPVKALAACWTGPVRFDPVSLARAVWLGWTRGKAPGQTLVLLAAQGPTNSAWQRKEMLANTLDSRQGALLLMSVSRAEDQALAGDKYAMSRALAAIGMPVPPILAEITPGSIPDFSTSPWIERRKLFLKPRHGSHSLGTAIVERGATSAFLVAGDAMPAPDFARWLSSQAEADSILVQPFLEPRHSLRDLSPRAPPWLQITTYRLPGGEARLLSGTLLLPMRQQGGEPSGTALLRAPVNPQNGKLIDGLWLERPQQRFAAVPWNDAPIRGRAVADWDEACRLALGGSALLPGLPVIGWDVLLAAEGPCIAEANTMVAFSEAQLWHFETGAKSPLTDALLQWIEPKNPYARA